MAGEFEQVLDNATRLIRAVLFIVLMGFWIVMTAGPYILWREFADAMTRATSTPRVWIVEQNVAISNSKMQAPFPLVDGHGKNSPTPLYYACLDSIRAAEDWLLAHGYKKADLHTAALSGRISQPKDVDGIMEISDYRNKQFLVRRVEGTKAYSVVALMVDYGDYDIHLIPYRYGLGKSPVDFSRFAKEDFRATGGVANTPHFPPLPWLSVEDRASHVWGDTAAWNYDVGDFLNNMDEDQADLEHYLGAVLSR